MFTRMTQSAVMVAGLSLITAGALAGTGAGDPPEATVQLDLQWLSPPQVTPEGGQAQAQQTPEYTRLQGAGGAAAANQASSFTWPLRYAIDTQRYPIVTLRYRARDLVAGPTYANKVMDVQLVDSGGRMNPLTVINLEDLVQDGAVHEIRKDLSQVPADVFIDQLRFNFQGGGAGTGGRLDIYAIVFDRGPNSPEPLKFTPQQVDFVVKDAGGNAVADAEVHLGLLERANWVALGSTDANGKVSLTVPATTRPDGTIDPVEAVVERQGNLPQYVAPIKLPAGSPVEVKLAPVAAAAQPAQPGQAAAQPGQPSPTMLQPVPAEAQGIEPTIVEQPEQVTYGTTVYNNTTTYVPYPVYTYTYVQPYPVYWWVPARYVRTRPVDWHDHDDRWWREHHRDRIDVPRYDHPRPVVVPPPTRIPEPPRPVRFEPGPGPVRPGVPTPGPGYDRDRNRDGAVRTPAPVVAPPPRLDTPPDLHRPRPTPGAEPSRPTNPPREMSPGPTRITPPDRPSRGDRNPIIIRNSDLDTPQRPAPAPTPAPAPAPAPAKVQDQPRPQEPPKSAPDRQEDSRTSRRIDPPARITPVERPARIQPNDDDNQRRQAQREEAQRAAESQREAQRAADTQRQETQRRDAERQEAQRRDTERQNAQQRDAERQEAQRQADAQREAQRAADARREADAREDVRRAEAQREQARRAEAQRDEARRADAQREEARRAAEAQRAESQREEARREAARREEQARQDAARRVAQANPGQNDDPNNPNDPNSGNAPPARVGAPGRPTRR